MTTEIDVRRGRTSASNAQADALCAGRHLAQKGIPETTSADATFGRDIHAALSKLPTPASLDALHAVPEFGALTLEQQGIAEGCLNLELRLLSQVFGDSWSQAECWREQRYWCKVPPGFEHSGQPDVVYRLGPRALILEYKTLAGDVPESSRNLQLRDQAVLVAGNLLVGDISVAVIQPLVTWEPELCAYTAADIARSEADMFARVAASNRPEAPRTPGEVQCRFCRAKPQCAEYSSWAAKLVPQATPLAVSMDQWTPSQRAQVADALPRLRKLLDEAEAFLKEMLARDATSVPGYTLEPGDIRERITDIQSTFDRFTSLGGTLQQFLPCLTATKSKLKEAISGLTGKRGKSLNQAMSDLVAGLTEQKQNNPSLKRLDP